MKDIQVVRLKRVRTVQQEEESDLVLMVAKNRNGDRGMKYVVEFPVGTTQAEVDEVGLIFGDHEDSGVGLVFDHDYGVARLPMSRDDTKKVAAHLGDPVEVAIFGGKK